MSRSPKLISPGAEPAPDMRQPFPDKRVQWHVNEGHAPGASLRGDHVDKHGLLKRDPPPRTDLGFAPRPGVRLVSVPDPRSVPGGPRTIGDEFRDLKDQLSSALKRIAALERGAGIETAPAPAVAVPEAADDETGDQRWDAPDLSPQQRIDRAMSESRAAMNRGAIRTRR
jgi:hypothetical protein